MVLKISFAWTNIAARINYYNTNSFHLSYTQAIFKPKVKLNTTSIQHLYVGKEGWSLYFHLFAFYKFAYWFSPLISDIDECSKTELNECQHKCKNTKGSYICSCNDGFRVDKDKENAMVCKVLASQVFQPLEKSEFELTIYSNFTLNLNFSSFFRT